MRFAPLAGLLIACIPALVAAIATSMRLPSLAAAALVLAAQVWATGALHEDGLADVADGFGGGSSREAKLAIMRDSRIGTYGAAALCCGFLLRGACLAQLLDRGSLGTVVAALLMAASMSRAAMLVPLALLPPARRDGLAQAMGRLPSVTLWWAFAVGFAVSAAAGWAAGLSPMRIAVACAAAPAPCALLTALARRQIDGVTGDVVGAGQQLAEMAVLVVVASDGLASG